tara:strand:- start:2404 stop:2676 length:273 start_codon:yes stop_codon:yes gene_type:complete
VVAGAWVVGVAAVVDVTVVVDTAAVAAATVVVDTAAVAAATVVEVGAAAIVVGATLVVGAAVSELPPQADAANRTVTNIPTRLMNPSLFP